LSAAQSGVTILVALNNLQGGDNYDRRHLARDDRRSRKKNGGNGCQNTGVRESTNSNNTDYAYARGSKACY
jgi:hypothetical protein